MKKSSLLCAILIGVFSSPVSASNLEYWTGLPNRLWTDVRTNTGLKIESTIPSVLFDSKSGTKFAGNTTPFLHIGSYLYTGYSVRGQIDPLASKALTGVDAGLRLNDVIRPFVKKGLAMIPKIRDNASLIEGMAQAVTVGYSGGHDFNYAEKSKLFINRYGITLGFEIAFGNKPSDQLGVQSMEKSWHLK